ncbi:hypothetical protein ACFDTO_17390 [Microbacteriaceae bacterium 4G12]
MILTAIVACEVTFWVFLVGGLTARYLLHRPRLGALLLIGAPVVDVLLLALVAVDLLGGGQASVHHGIAALYIGVSVAYGHRMIAWADVRFQHRFNGGPAPKAPTGWAYTAKCWKDVARTALAAVIAAGILAALIALVNSPARTQDLTGFFPILGLVVAIEIVWAASYTVWPKKGRAGSYRAAEGY